MENDNNPTVPQVIHKTNSFIAVIYGYAQLIRDHQGDVEMLKRWNTKILEACDELQKYLQSVKS